MVRTASKHLAVPSAHPWHGICIYGSCRSTSSLFSPPLTYLVSTPHLRSAGRDTDATLHARGAQISGCLATVLSRAHNASGTRGSEASNLSAASSTGTSSFAWTSCTHTRASPQQRPPITFFRVALWLPGATNHRSVLFRLLDPQNIGVFGEFLQNRALWFEVRTIACVVSRTHIHRQHSLPIVPWTAARRLDVVGYRF